MPAARPILVVIAGHDPSGAGIDADREALAGLALEARFLVSAWTQQDSGGLRSIGARRPEEWLAEARRELPAAAIKFGLLPGSGHVHAAAELVHEARERIAGASRVPGAADGRDTARPWVVVDPVLASSSGGRFLAREEALDYLRVLAPAGVILTPNLVELAELTGAPLAELARRPAARVGAAEKLLARGASAVVVKGGHGEEAPARDLVLLRGGGETWLEHARLPGAKVRGSGCRFASRLAGELALGATLAQAAQAASAHVLERLRASQSGA